MQSSALPPSPLMAHLSPRSLQSHSPLLPTASTPLSPPLSLPQQQKQKQQQQQPQQQQQSSRIPLHHRSATHAKSRPTLKRHKSTPNLSRPVTGLDSLEDDPARVRNHSKLNVHDWHRQKTNRAGDSYLVEDGKGDSLFNTNGTISHNGHTESKTDQETEQQHLLSQKVAETVERRINPFDTQSGEFKGMDPEGPEEGIGSVKAIAAPIGYTPPPHALPMELVLLQTFNDSDHLPEHHEWTQDADYWYYVTKAHGVKRRKLKKVSSWWLDMGSLGGALLLGSSTPASSEPIATGPIYNMGRMTPLQPSSPLSSEVALGNGHTSISRRHQAKDSISSLASQDSSIGSPSMTPTTAIGHHPFVGGVRKPSSPRNSHLGKYYHVDWEEYTSL